MQLSTYLDREGLTRAAFAARVNVHEVTVSKWCSGAMLPSWPSLKAIQRETNGAVTAADFMPGAVVVSDAVHGADHGTGSASYAATKCTPNDFVTKANGG